MTDNTHISNKELFQDIVDDAGIPSTADDLQAKFREIAVEEGVVFNNQSGYSPFWRMVLALVTKPVLWLVGLLINDFMPQAFLKTATGIWVDLKLWEMGLERKKAQKAQGLITLSRDITDDELVIPAGTVFQTSAIDDVFYRMISLEEQTLLVGSDSIDVLCEAETEGAGYNLGADFFTVHNSDLAGITNITNGEDWLIVPGADAETDDEAKLRFQNQFTAINQWHTDAVYKALVSEFASVSIDDIYFEHDAPRGPGTANILLMPNSGVYSAAFLNSVTAKIMNGTQGLSDDVKVMNIPKNTIDITAHCLAEDNLTPAEKVTLKVGIENFIKTAFRDLSNDNYQPTLIKPNSLFVWSRLIKECHAEFGDLLSIDFEDDSNVETALNIVGIDQLTVTVN